MKRLIAALFAAFMFAPVHVFGLDKAVAWNANPPGENVVQYDICISTVGEVTALFAIRSCSIFDSTTDLTYTADLEFGNAYYFGVRAVNARGIPSYWTGRTDAGEALVADLTRPSNPTGAKVTVKIDMALGTIQIFIE